MFEDLRLPPFSQEELQKLILEEYKQPLESCAEDQARKAEQAKSNEQPEKLTEEQKEEHYLYWHHVEEESWPLRKAVSGKLGPLKSSMLGWQLPQLCHPLAQLTIRKTLSHPQFNPIAKRVVRLLKTPDETWAASAKEMDKTYGLTKRFYISEIGDEPEKEKIFVYKYYTTVLAEGDVNSRLSYLHGLFNNWKEGLEERQKELDEEMKEFGRIFEPLPSLCDLEYQSFVISNLKRALYKKGRIEAKIPFYISSSLTFLEETKRIHPFISKGVYAFRAYGNAVDTVEDIMKRTTNAGFSVRQVKELLPPIMEPFYLFSVKP